MVMPCHRCWHDDRIRDCGCSYGECERYGDPWWARPWWAEDREAWAAAVAEVNALAPGEPPPLSYGDLNALVRRLGRVQQWTALSAVPVDADPGR